MKKLLIIVVIMVVAVVAGLTFYFDSLLKNGIETAGSAALDTEVSVASVGISPLSGSGGIRNLQIGNPEGFDSPYAMELGGLDVSIDVGSVFSDVIVVDSIIIQEPVITYETRVTTDNIRALIANLGGGSDSDSAPASGGPGKQVIIRDFQMLSPRVNLVSAIASAPITLPDLRLQNIGEDNSAVTVAEAGRQIFSAISQAVLSSELPDLDAIRDQVEQQVTERVEELEQQADDQIEELEDRVDQQVEDLTDRLRSVF